MKKLWKFPEEVNDFVREHGHEGSIEEMRQRLCDEMGFVLTYDQTKNLFSRLKVHAAPRRGRKMPWKSKYPADMEGFVRSIAKGKSSEELAKAVNAKYGEGTITPTLMRAYKHNHGITTGFDARFAKGHVPENKGKRQEEFMSPEAIERTKATRFQKGHTPHNGGTPVGAITMRRDSGGRCYYWVKVAQPNRWRMKHVVEWERACGKVPEGYMVTFANGDSTDCRIENLLLVTRAQHAIKNRWGIHGYDLESAKAANQVADLKSAISSVKKKRKIRRTKIGSV